MLSDDGPADIAHPLETGMKLGIGTYCYMWAIGFTFGDKEAKPDEAMDAFGLLRRAHELGVNLIQYGPNLPLAALSDADLDRLLAQAKAWEIELELGTRGLETDHLARQVALAKCIGSKLLRTIPEIGGKPVSADEIPPHLRAIWPLLEKEGIKLGLENGKIPALELKAAIDASGSASVKGEPAVGVVLDVVNSLAVPEGWRYVTEILAPYTICLHHKEFIIQRYWHMMGFEVQGRPAGAGQLDTPWLLETLDRAGAKYSVILEVWPPEQPALADTIALEDRWVRESLSYLRLFIKD
jgi:sugar phosphate isomerase/epimerase